MEIPIEDFSGGLWLLWTNSIQFQLEVLVDKSRFKYYRIRFTWLETFVYGYHNSISKQPSRLIFTN